jgi:hypothetical protein
MATQMDETTTCTEVSIKARLGALTLMLAIPVGIYFAWNIDASSKSSDVYRIALIGGTAAPFLTAIRVLFGPGKKP